MVTDDGGGGPKREKGMGELKLMEFGTEKKREMDLRPRWKTAKLPDEMTMAIVSSKWQIEGGVCMQEPRVEGGERGAWRSLYRRLRQFARGR